MSIETKKINPNYTPLENPEYLEVDIEKVFLEETKSDDPDLLELAQNNNFAIMQGELNMELMNSLEARKDGRIYKIRAGEDGDIAGVIYGITRGRDYGTMELAYYLDEGAQGQGIMGASVAAIKDRFGSEYSLMFDIHNDNTPSIKIARAIGGLALDESGDHTKYFTTRRRK